MATNKKGKTSKNSKKGSGKAKVIDYTKKIREKKKEIKIELTDTILAEVMKEDGIIDTYQGKKIKKIETFYGKRYIILDNTEISSI